MFHIRLIKGRSYYGIVSATQEAPDVFVSDPAVYKAAMKSGHFELVEGPAEGFEAAGSQGETTPPADNGENGKTITGHLDPAQLSEMTVEQLNQLADDMQIEGAADMSRDELIEAISKVEVEAEAAEVVELSEMTVAQLKEYAKENGIALTGCSTKPEILQKINEYEADAAAAAAMLAGNA